MAYIEIDHLTKDYGQGRGIFDLSLQVNKGEIYGFAGVNGAGKTTTIRHLMGFLFPDSGTATIDGKDCMKKSAEVKKMVSYVPGEINFPGNTTGEFFLKNQIYLSGRGNWAYCQEICDRLQLDPTANVRAMSKGMKQKTAIAAAFSSEAPILIMDEPTTGLDPLMRDTFLELLAEQKAMERTIFMSSHIFEEMESVCDHVAIIREGHIINVVNMDDIRYNKNKTFKLEFKTKADFDHFYAKNYTFEKVKPAELQLNVAINDHEINTLMQDLKVADLVFFKEIKVTFEDYFLQAFKEDNKNVFKTNL